MKGALKIAQVQKEANPEISPQPRHFLQLMAKITYKSLFLFSFTCGGKMVLDVQNAYFRKSL